MQKDRESYERWVPEPVNEADDMRHINDFVVTAISATRNAIDTRRQSPVDVAAG